MEIRVYVANLNKYSEGTVDDRCFTLPMDADELTEEIEKFANGDEYGIFSYEAPFFIGELDNLHTLNEQMQELEILGKNLSDKEMTALLEWVDNLEDAISLLRDGRVRFYDTKIEYPQWSDLAELLVYEHGYMQIPDRLKDYMDFEQIGRDLWANGNWYLCKNGIAVEEIR